SSYQRRQASSTTLFPYTTLFRSDGIPDLFSALVLVGASAFGGALLGSIIGSTGVFGKTVMPESVEQHLQEEVGRGAILIMVEVRSEGTRLNSSHLGTSYAVICLQ